jgi:hypothetical protein
LPPFRDRTQYAAALGATGPDDRRGHPLRQGRGWRSPIDLATLYRLVADRPDRTTAELTRAYSAEVPSSARVHRSSVLRALRRTGYVFKKNGRDRRNKIVRMSKLSAPPSSTGPRA